MRIALLILAAILSVLVFFVSGLFLGTGVIDASSELRLGGAAGVAGSLLFISGTALLWPRPRAAPWVFAAATAPFLLAALAEQLADASGEYAGAAKWFLGWAVVALLLGGAAHSHGVTPAGEVTPGSAALLDAPFALT
jgi:hypothetical protein